MEYTSIATTPGFADNTVKTAYDLAVAWVLRERPQYRMFVDKRPERPSMPGSSIVLNKYDYLTEANVTAAKTALNEEADVDSVKLQPTKPVTLTFNEYGATVTRTNKLNLMSFADVDVNAAVAVADHMGRVLDEQVQDVLASGTQDLFSGGQAAVGTITASHTLAASDVRRAVTKLRSGGSSETGAAVPWEGQFYAGGAHPKVIHDLRQETGSGSWRVPQEYGASQERIWKGEVGEFEGVRFFANNYTRNAADGATGAQVYRTFVMGREVVAEGVLLEPGVRIGPVVDKLMRFRHVGWYGVYGHALYRDNALVTIHSGSSVASL